MSATTLPVRLDDSHRDALMMPINCWNGSAIEEFDDVETPGQFDQALASVETIGRVWHAVNDGELTVDDSVRELLTRWRDDYGQDIADWERDPSQLGDDYDTVIGRTRSRIAALDELLAADGS